MNYLAHLFLADDTPESLIGNLLGDFVKGRAKEQYSNFIQRGIELHRKVDFYTDSHQVVRNAKQLVSLPRRRYAGILLDMFYDHFLANHWQDYSQTKLNNFTEKVYAVLLQNQTILPDKLRIILPLIIGQDLLGSYQEIDGIDRALKRIAPRLRNGEIFASGIEELQAHYKEFDLSFQDFFPDLVRYVRAQR